MSRNCDGEAFVNNSQETHSDSEKHPEILVADLNKYSVILKRACQANTGKWDAVIADAIAARQMDPRSLEERKLCARAALVGGDVDAALDCLHEALHINHKDREACAILQEVVEDQLNKTLEVR